MAAERRIEPHWISSTLSSALPASDPSSVVSSAAAHGIWSSTVQPEMLNAISSHTTDVWEQLLDRRTGSGNKSDGDVTSRAETDDNANCAKLGDSASGVRASSSTLSYGAGVERPPQEVTSEATGSHHVFSDVDYHVLCRHVMQGDLDDHVITTDRKSLDSRKLILQWLPYCLGSQGWRLYVFKVFIEYPLNLGSGCISMFSVNLTFHKTLVMQFSNFFCKNRHFLGYKCVSIQNSAVN